MTFNYEQMLKNRAAGTQGDFVATNDKEDGDLTWVTPLNKDFPFDWVACVCVLDGFETEAEANCLRFASVPHMEAEIIRLRKTLKAVEYSLRSSAGPEEKKNAAEMLRATLKGDGQ